MDPYQQSLMIETAILRSEYRNTTALPIEYRIAVLAANRMYPYGFPFNPVCGGGPYYAGVYPFIPALGPIGYPLWNPYFNRS